MDEADTAVSAAACCSLRDRANQAGAGGAGLVSAAADCAEYALPVEPGGHRRHAILGNRYYGPK